MTAPHKQLVEDVASASVVESFVVCEIVAEYQDSVAVLPALLAHLHILGMFVDYPLERLRIPFVEINLLIVFHVRANSNILLNGLPG